MGNYYFDIETTGLDAKTNKIITIQFQELMDKHEIKLITRPERYVEVKLSK